MAGGAEAISNDSPGGVGRVGAEGAVLNPPPFDYGIGAHLTLLD